MHTQGIRRLTACALGAALAFGCATASSNVYGQTPATGSAGYQPVRRTGFMVRRSGGHGRHHVAHGSPYCRWGGHHGSRAFGRPSWRPLHRHSYTYRPPQNLKYPPANQPAAFVQYPYYTVKGPKDFFWDGDGR